MDSPTIFQRRRFATRTTIVANSRTVCLCESPRWARRPARAGSDVRVRHTSLCTFFAEPLSLSFNHGGFRGGHKARCEIPPLAFLLSSSGFLERRVTLRPAREAPFGPTRRPPAGFRSLRRGAHRRQERRETPKRPAWRQPPVSLRALPRQAAVLRARAGQPQLGVGSDDEPGPPIRLFGVPDPRRGPPERLLEEADRVLEVEPPDVSPPQQIEVQFVFAGEPEPELLGLAALAGE